MIKNCENCKYCLINEYGYSNYTVEGSYFNCLKGQHPDGEFDRFYCEDKRLEYAEKCPSFAEGESTFLDVDREQVKNEDDLSAYNSDPEIVGLLNEWAKKYL